MWFVQDFVNRRVESEMQVFSPSRKWPITQLLQVIHYLRSDFFLYFLLSLCSNISNWHDNCFHIKYIYMNLNHMCTYTHSYHIYFCIQRWIILSSWKHSSSLINLVLLRLSHFQLIPVKSIVIKGKLVVEKKQHSSKCMMVVDGWEMNHPPCLLCPVVIGVWV